MRKRLDFSPSLGFFLQNEDFREPLEVFHRSTFTLAVEILPQVIRTDIDNTTNGDTGCLKERM